jgi:uncharacterized protein
VSGDHPAVAAVEERLLEVARGEASLAGSLWLPEQEGVATVLMHPGSGPSDRHNDVYFPQIRDHLLRRGIAVASFDKRGVGGSSGRWQEAGIEDQSEDALACVTALRSDAGTPGPIGLYGHSQGGWVVVEAAANDPHVAFVVVNSGPGVTPAEQERYALLTAVRRSGSGASEVAAVERFYDRLIASAREGASLEEAREALAREGSPAVLEDLEIPFLPDDTAEWEFACSIVDYDPRPALERIRVPVLALFGEADTIVPVAESARVYRESVSPDLLTLVIVPGADHRLQTGNPPRLADGYLERVAEFVLAALA